MKLRIVFDRGPVSLVSDRGMVAEMLAESDDARRRERFNYQSGGQIICRHLP